MTTIIAVDPGNMTGLAVGRFTSTGPPQHESLELEPMKALDWVSDRLREGASLAAYETFKPRKGVYTWQPEALYVIGAVRYLCYLSDTPCIGQEPADAKRFSTNRKLEVLGWRNPSEGGHRDDASRHLLVAAVNGNLIDPEVFL